MEKLVGKIIETRGAKWQITGYKMIETEYQNIIKACENSGKYPAYFFGHKIMRSGKISEKQCVICLFFKNTEHFVTL
jgi:hypothetical protein